MTTPDITKLGSEQPAPYNPLEGERPEFSFKLQEQGSEERISIIVVHHNRPEYLNLCLLTITLASLNNNFELIVVDNGSEQESQNFLKELEEDGVKVIRNSENRFWAKAANQGAKAAHKDSKYLVFMHHDVIVLNPAWLDLMINVSESQKSGVVGLQIGNYEVNGQRMGFVHENCMLVTRECWNDCGPFAEELPQEGSPFLFNVAATRAGYNPLTIDQRRTPCVHHWGVFSLNYNEYERLADEAQRIMPKLYNDLQVRFA